MSDESYTKDAYVKSKVKEVLSALNTGASSLEIEKMVDGYIMDIIDHDSGDKEGNTLFTRMLVTTLSSQTRRVVFSSVSNTPRLISLINNIIRPSDEYEHRLWNRVSISIYTKRVFGEGFLSDLEFVVNGYTGTVDPVTRNWLESNFIKGFADRPRWVNRESGDNSHLTKRSEWKRILDINLHERYGKAIQRALDVIEEVENDDYGDMADDYVTESNAFRTSTEEEYDFIHDIRLTPKREVKYKDSDTVSINRVFGPLNSFINQECDNDLDGCRMLNCNCLLHETSIPGEKWFTGSCDHCNRPIRDMSYAVRYPELNGGWLGCYCCESCVRSYSGANQEQIDWTITMLNEYGIMNRVW